MEDQTRWDGYAGPPTFQPRHFAIIAAAGISPGMRVLDVATGRGETAILAAQSGAHVVATDIGENLVATAHSNAENAGVSIVTAVADMRVLAGIEPGFEVVLGCASLHHLDEVDCRKAVAAACDSWFRADAPYFWSQRKTSPGSTL